MYVADIFIGLNTAIYERGLVITKKRDIVKKYISFWLLKDVLVLIPFVCEMIHLQYKLKFWNMIVILKL